MNGGQVPELLAGEYGTCFVLQTERSRSGSVDPGLEASTISEQRVLTPLSAISILAANCERSCLAGMYLMGARHYSPELGRFVQPDPIRVESNVYAYAGSNPVTRIDPDGTAQVATAMWSGGGGWGPAISVAIRWVGPVAGVAVTGAAALAASRLNLAANKKQTKKVIAGLERQIREHEAKLEQSPHSRAANHWRREIATLQRRVQSLKQRLRGN